MTSDEKIKWVRNKVYEQEKLTGLGIATYSLLPVEQEINNDLDIFFNAFAIEEAATGKPSKKRVVVITVEEQIEILKRLEKQKLIKILELNKKDALLEVAPAHPSPIKLKTLEHISRKLADTFTGSQIVDTLLDYGIPRADIPYPNTKWFTLREMFVALATSPNPEQREKFSGAITTFLHPLNFNADETVSRQLIDDFNQYLKYDGYEITVADDGDGYKLVATKNKAKIVLLAKPQMEDGEKAERVDEEVAPSLPKNTALPEITTEQETRKEMEVEYSDGVEWEIEILQGQKSAEGLAVVREAYKTLMAIVSSFCADPTTPSRELNAAYTRLERVVWKELEAPFCGGTTPFSTFRLDLYKEDNFGIPFHDLYSAELSFKKKGRELHWNEVRPAMNAMLGEIEELCNTANSPDVIPDPEIQKVINDAMLLLSETAAKRKGANAAPAEHTIKMEITKMPELQIKNVEDKRKGLYITKKDDDFSYKGLYINLSKKTDYYKVFSALYAKLPNGGEISYKDLIAEIRSRLPHKTEEKTNEEMQKFIQRNLTDKNNGFMRYAGIPETEDNGKSLIEVNRGNGIVFNNKTG